LLQIVIKRIERADIDLAIPAPSTRRGRDGSSLVAFLPVERSIQATY